MSRYLFGFLLASLGGTLAKPDREKPSQILEKPIGNRTDSRPQNLARSPMPCNWRPEDSDGDSCGGGRKSAGRLEEGCRSRGRNAGDGGVLEVTGGQSPAETCFYDDGGGGRRLAVSVHDGRSSYGRAGNERNVSVAD